MNLNPEIMWPFFKNNPTLTVSEVEILGRSSHYGINSVQYRGSLLWNYLPRTVKESVSL